METSAGELRLPEGEDVHEFLQSMSEGLPVVPPTRARVVAMLSATRREGNEELGKCPPNYHVVTVQNVAINAVMAGCAPKHMRVVLAAVEAMIAPEFGLHGNSATTMGATPCIIVNGPVRDEAGLNYKHGALGSGHRANACIGRAIKLVLLNVGGAKLGGTESSTLGTPMKYSMCVAEWEEKAADWEPFHVQRGMDSSASAVTVMAVAGGPLQLVDFYTKDADRLCQLMADSLSVMYSSEFPLINECLLVVSPEHYQTLRKGGITSKKQLAKKLWDSCNKNMAPALRHVVGRQVPGLLGVIIGYLLGMLARLLNLITGKGFPLVPKFNSPESMRIIVAGGPAGKFSAFCPGFGVGKAGMPSYNMSQAVTRPVEPAVPELATQMSGPEGQVLLDPRGINTASPFKLCPRSPDMAGGVALLDISKPGGLKLLDRIEARLRADFPNTPVFRFKKPTFCRPCPDLLRAQVISKCRMVVSALAD